MIVDAKHRVLTPMWSKYVKWKLGRAFRGVWVEGQLPPGSEPLVLYANHTNFWDGFIAHLVVEHAGRDGYAVMEEINLRRFRMLTRLGAFSVERGSARSSLQTLRHAATVLRRPAATVLIFPQGAIGPFNHALRFERGVEVLARKSQVRCVPMAVRYAMFEHEYPDVVVRVGPPHAAETAEAMARRLTALRDDVAALAAPAGVAVIRGRRSLAE
jgi:1-acyl-sn-glycerol-3-phosphate acyltransferase